MQWGKGTAPRMWVQKPPFIQIRTKFTAGASTTYYLGNLSVCHVQIPELLMGRGEGVDWPSSTPSMPLSFFLYILPSARSSIIGRCTLYTPGCRMKAYKYPYLITAGFFNLHKGWLSLHRGHPDNVPIRMTMQLSSVIPAYDTRESVLGSEIFLAASGDRIWDLYM